MKSKKCFRCLITESPLLSGILRRLHVISEGWVRRHYWKIFHICPSAEFARENIILFLTLSFPLQRSSDCLRPLKIAIITISHGTAQPMHHININQTSERLQ